MVIIVGATDPTWRLTRNMLKIYSVIHKIKKIKV